MLTSKDLSPKEEKVLFVWAALIGGSQAAAQPDTSLHLLGCSLYSRGIQARSEGVPQTCSSSVRCPLDKWVQGQAL